MTQSTIKLTPATHGIKVLVKTPDENGWAIQSWYVAWNEMANVEFLSELFEDLTVKDFKWIVQQLGELHREHYNSK
jgi:hypothetical protein